MKKFILFCMLVMTAGVAFSQGNNNEEKEEKDKKIIVGGQIGFNNGIGSTESSTLKNNGWKIDRSRFGFTASIYGAYLIFSNFRLQLGIDFDTNNSHMASVQVKTTSESGYSSLDIPLVANYSFSFSDRIYIKAGLGPYMSVPVSKRKANYSDGSGYEEPLEGPNFGILGGIGGGYKIGDGFITLDMRYLSDFTTVTHKSDQREILNRRGLAMLVGYEHRF